MGHGADGTRRCYAHPQEGAITQCKRCGLAMCDRCYEHDVAGAPACGLCTHEAATRSQRAVSLAISIVGLGGGGVAWAHASGHLTAASAVLGAAGAVTLAAIVFLLVRLGSHVEIEARDREQTREADHETLVAHPYRQLARRVALRVSPKVSASGVVFALVGSFVATGILFPTLVKLPRWLEIEVVLGAYWLLVTATLSTLLYRGYRLRDDWTLTSPLRALWAKDAPKPVHGARHADAGHRSTSTGSGCDPGCIPEIPDEGILVAIVVVVAIIALLGVAWVLVEIAMPLVLFVTYRGILAALKRAANDRHDCEGNLARAIGWGAFWAAFCLLPVAGVVWVALVAVVG